MTFKWTLLALVILVNISRAAAQSDCPQRDEPSAGRRCERPCSSEGTCRRQNRECLCDGFCGLSCLKKKCPALGVFGNGSISLDTRERFIDTVATYSCNRRYRLVGNATRTCQVNKEWSGSTPVCEVRPEVICEALEAPSEGQVTYFPEERTVGTNATYRCDAGYNLVGNQKRTCREDGSWSGSAVGCFQGEECERNEDEITRLGRRCMRPCNRHEDCFGNRQCVCDDICGMSCIPTGREEYCPGLQERGANFTLTIEPSSRVFGSIATYSCRRNFELVRGDLQLRCLGVGEWSGTPSVCLHRYRCEPPPEIENARPTELKEYYDHGEQLAFSCSPGFARVGGIRAVLTCHRNTWNEPQFQCRRKSCGDPGYLLNGRKIGTSFLFRDTVRYECDVGYRLIGAEERYCQSNQEWTRVTPTCQAVRCPAVTHPANGRRIGYDFVYDSELDFRCNIGYILEGSDEIRCQANGTWSRPLPTCREIRCPAPAVPEHGRSDPDTSEYRYGDTVTFTCDPDYQLRGNSVVTCSSNEDWSSAPPICQLTCTVPIPPRYGGWRNGAREGDNVLEGQELNYYCHNSHFKCQVLPLRCVDGSWTPPASMLCLRGCPMETAQTVGLNMSYSHPDDISCTHQSLKPVGTIRSFTCLRGYRLRIQNGVSHQSTCVRQRTRQVWSSSQPVCEKILCPSIRLTNGRVQYTLNGRLTSTREQNTTASFFCNPGYEKSHHNSTSCDVGVWTNEKPDCIEEPCSESSIVVGLWDVRYNIPESESSPGYRIAGTIATFNCTEYGYSTTIQQTCRRGRWEGQRPICQRIPCQDEVLNNGRPIYTPNRVVHDTVRTYQCYQGFTLQGIESSHCDAGRWTNDLPECIEDPCSENDIDGGGWSLVYNSHSEEQGFRPPGTVVRLGCPRGYESSGTKTCQTGTWRGSQLSCDIIPCPREELDHGRVLYVPPRAEQGTFRTFECSQGYHFLNPPDESRCDVGQWTTELPLCVEDPCREDDIADDQWRIAYNRGTRQAGIRPHGTVASFQCTERGHETRDTLECRTGQWTGPPVICNKTPCQFHGSVQNGHIAYSTDRPEQGTILSVTCYEGYQLSASGQALCDVGQWTPDLPTCEEKSCDEADLRNQRWNVIITYQSDRIPNDNMKSPGTVATLSCNSHGHLAVPIQGARKECELGEWSGASLICDRVPCNNDSPSNVLFHYYDISNQSTEQPKHGDRRTAQCTEGSTFTGGSHESICMSGTWTGETPACTSNPCRPLENLPGSLQVSYNQPEMHDNISTIVYPHHTTATLSCVQEGFVIEGDAEIRCKRGNWRNFENYPNCVRASCPNIAPQHGRITYFNGTYVTSKLFHGDVITILCDDGYRPSDNSIEGISCVNGIFSQDPPTCEEANCPALPLEGYSFITYNGTSSSNAEFSPWTRVQVACPPEMYLEMDGQAICRRGQWNPGSPTCSQSAPCQAVVDVPGREIYYSDDLPYSHGSNLTVTCEQGDTLIGNEVSTCIAGTWSPAVGECFSNVAWNKAAYQASTPYSQRDASKAIDGINRNERELCAQTHNGLQDPWWFVDLSNTYTVEKILIYHPLGYGNGLRNSVVRVGQETGTQLGQNTMVGEITDINSNPITIHVNGTVKGRFISVDHQGRSFDALILCEVEVIGKLSGEECERGCVVPRPLPNGEYYLHPPGAPEFTSIASGRCFSDTYLYASCDEGNLQGRRVYTCDTDSGVLSPSNVNIFEWPRCGSNCPRPQINPNVVYHVGNVPVNDRTFFTPDEIVTSRCEDPMFQKHVGSVNMRCQRNGEWNETAPMCITSQLRMDIATVSSVTKASNGSFVLLTTTDEVNVTCTINQNDARLREDSSLQKDRGILLGIQKSVDGSEIGFTIHNPTTADSGVYKCISGELSHSIRIVFEDPPQCPRPLINDNVIAIIGLSPMRVGADRQFFNEEESLTFLCEEEEIHRFDGPQRVHCRNGDWIDVATDHRMEDAPTCTAIGCRRPHINNNVVVHFGEEDTPITDRQFFREGEIITSRCDNPRIQLMNGSVRRRCTDREWTGTAPTCVDSQLRIGVDNTVLVNFLPDGTFVVFPVTGQVWINCRKPSGTPFGNSVTITTNSTVQPNRRIVRNSNRLRRLVIYNPIPENSGTYTCSENTLRRSINIRFQYIRCEEPEPVSNGRWQHIKANANRFTPTSYIFMEKVRLHCNSGYRISGTQDSQCNYKGRWSPPLASCVAN